MKVKTWKLTDNRWALYTEELEKAKDALQHPALRLMGTYYRCSGGFLPGSLWGRKKRCLP